MIRRQDVEYVEDCLPMLSSIRMVGGLKSKERKYNEKFLEIRLFHPSTTTAVWRNHLGFARSFVGNAITSKILMAPGTVCIGPARLY